MIAPTTTTTTVVFPNLAPTNPITKNKNSFVILPRASFSSSSILDSNSSSRFPLGSRIVVKNIGNWMMDESVLRNHFSNFGAVAEVKVVKDEKSSKRSKALAFIQYTSQDDALLALESMDHMMLDGQIIYVEIAKPGKGSFGKYPKTCGPPPSVMQCQHNNNEEAADCWY